MMRKANPKMIIKIWSSYVVNKYATEIDAGDIGFFINKDYKDDLERAENSEKIMESIDRLRNPIRLMSEEDRGKSMKYIQNLKKLSILYEQIGK